METDLRRWINLFEASDQPSSPVPAKLTRLAKAIQGRSYNVAKRVIVAKVGSVGSRETIDDDVADAVFNRLQRNAQVGAVTSEDDLHKLGRGAERLTGTRTITLYRAAPQGAGIRPGDFTASSPDEAGFYKHGGNTIQSITVARTDVVSVRGSVGGGQEYVYLPKDYHAPTPTEYFPSLRAFYAAVNPSVALGEAMDRDDYDDDRGDGDDPNAPWQQRWKNTITLKAGTILYHGTSQRYSATDIDGPAWFTTERQVAKNFSKRHAGKAKIVVYHLVWDLELPQIDNKREFDDFAEMFAIDTMGTEDMQDSMRHSSLPGWYIPNNYNPGDDILIVDMRVVAPGRV